MPSLDFKNPRRDNDLPGSFLSGPGKFIVVIAGLLNFRVQPLEGVVAQLLQLPQRVAVYDPFRPSTKIANVRVEKIFPSNTRPLLLALLPAQHRKTPPSRLICCTGGPP